MSASGDNIIADKYGNQYHFKEMFTLSANQTDYFLIFLDKNNKDIGTIFATTRKNGKDTEIEYYIHDKAFEGRGIATAMLGTMIDKLFGENKIETIPHKFKPKYKTALNTALLVIAYNDEMKNEASLRVAQKCGFDTPEPRYGGVNATLTKEDYLNQKAQNSEPKLEKQEYIEPKASTKNNERVA